MKCLNELAELDAEIGARISFIRRLRGLSAEALGDRIGVTGRMILRYESGASPVYIDTLIRIARALAFDPGALLLGPLEPPLPIDQSGPIEAASWTAPNAKPEGRRAVPRH